MQPTDAADVAKLAPPAIVSALSLFGVPLDDWIKIFTFLYLLVMIASKIYSTWIRDAE